MNDDKKIIKTTKRIYPQIYSYTLPDFQQIKVGKKSDIQNVKTLIREY